MSSASDVTVRALIPQANGRFAEGPPPERLPSEAATVLDVYGSLFFAGARTLANALPSPVGATLIETLDDYADALAEVGGRLYLSGVDGPTRLPRAAFERRWSGSCSVQPATAGRA